MGLRRQFRKLFGIKRQTIELQPSGWLAENVFCQSPSTPLSEIVHVFDPKYKDPDPINLVHIVNFFSVDGAMNDVQRATLDSMVTAKSDPLAGEGETTLVQVPVHGDEDLIQAHYGLQVATKLERTVLDVGTFRIPRPLPLLFDILEKGASVAKPGDFVIYTNADICLQPYFYGAVRQLIAGGFDAITINRRTFGDAHGFSHDPLSMGEVGMQHPGFDCFVFSKEVFDQFVRTDSCLGMSGVIQPMLFNLAAHSKRMLMLKNVSLTFHFGDDRPWKTQDFDDYAMHNFTEAADSLTKLAEDVSKRGHLREFCDNHIGIWKLDDDGLLAPDAAREVAQAHLANNA